MTEVYDAIIIGSGPAGTSAAFPLLESGHRVLMIDGDVGGSPLFPSAAFSDARQTDVDQWRWMLGSKFYAMKAREIASPKFRVPALESVFSDFQAENRIHTHNFTAVGSLAAGGLSNAWGCGVTQFDQKDLAEFPFPPTALQASYERVARRIGISGRSNDDLEQFHGLDQWAQDALPLDRLHVDLLAKYTKNRDKFQRLHIKMGRSRLAVLSADLATRKGCNLSGNCLWGCSRGALYNSRSEFERLARIPTFQRIDGIIAGALSNNVEGWTVDCRDRRTSTPVTLRGRKILLAAGCIASTRLVLDYLNLVQQPVRLVSNPTAGFLAWFPRALGAVQQTGFTGSQLSLSISSESGELAAFAALFPTRGLPTSEFLRYLPISSRYGIDFLKTFLPSCVAGNIFFPGSLSDHRMVLSDKRELHITGGFSPDLALKQKMISRSMAKAIWLLGGIIPPGGCVLGAPGTDVHYVGSLPMRAKPQLGECHPTGEIEGMRGAFAIDGASLPSLPVKSHTLTIMANSDRIAAGISVAAN